MRTHVVALVAAAARSDIERDLGESPADRGAAARVAMRAARGHFMAPEETEAFAGAVVALSQVYPDDASLHQEVSAIGDRNRLLGALSSGVPVDFDRLQLTDFPEDAVGLIDIWNETAKATA